MSTYRGPHTEVIQRFQATPGAVAVESLPSAVIATPYDVYVKENLLTYNGVDPDHGGSGSAVAWTVDGDNKVVYSVNQGKKIFNMYPCKAYVRDRFSGVDYELESRTFTSTGFTVARTDTYTFLEPTSTRAYMPIFEAAATGVASIDEVNAKKLYCSVGKFVDNGLVAGLQVVGNNGTNNVIIGVVDRVESNTVLYLKANYTTLDQDFDTLYIGLQTVAGAIGATITLPSTSVPAFVYDVDTNFNRANVKRGDIVDITSSQLGVDTTPTASVVSVVTDNLIEIWAGTAQSGNYTGTGECTISKMYATASTATTKAPISAYAFRRFAAFSKKLAYTGTVSSVSGTTLNGTSAFTGISVGDKVQIGTGLTGLTFTVVSITDSDTVVLDADLTGGSGAIYIWATTQTEESFTSGVYADYRAVKVDNLGVVYNSRDNKLTGSDGLFGVASVYNDLAFMISAISGLNAGRVMYAVAVDPTDDISTQYSEAMEALKFFDVYSHAFGTDEAAVNALAPAYVDEQSDPYEGHERIAVLAYDQEDTYKLGQGAQSALSSGLFTVSGLDLTTIGMGIGDQVEYTDVNGDLQTVNVTAAVTSSSQVQTDATIARSASSTDIVFYAGTKSKQANKIRALAIGNRRVTVVWPGKFYADTVAAGVVPAMTSVELPAYFLTAAIVGLDGGQKVSQSFTRLLFGIPGLSNIQLNTSSYFRKSDLDNIGGAGIDIMVQASKISNTIYSRHDLTTNMDAIEYRERSITKQADSAAKTLRNSIDPYIGKYNIDENLLQFLSTILVASKKGILKEGVLKELVIESVQQDPDIADKVNILITATVFVAANYYEITMTVVSR